MNPLYQMMMGQNPMSAAIQQFMQFRNNFRGNARQQVQQLLNSGRVTQSQYNAAVQMANQIQNMIGGR